MAKKSGPAAPVEEEAPETPPPVERVGGKVPSKTEAIRRALQSGVSQPVEVANWVRQEFGVEVTPAYVSNVKSSLAAPGKSGTLKGKKAVPVDGESLAKDLATLKALKDKYGEEGVKSLLGVL